MSFGLILFQPSIMIRTITVNDLGAGQETVNTSFLGESRSFREKTDGSLEMTPAWTNIVFSRSCQHESVEWTVLSELNRCTSRWYGVGDNSAGTRLPYISTVANIVQQKTNCFSFYQALKYRLVSM
ncbi:hypothetical protein RRG08_041536 [Elysia crispata]|uniref:Uncharacterized protein n=1 Tax=Elysia crispata TaxID=231223 RepID=A0AAE0ZUC8_9GAST|nr:hypothetical protein RRG08_041536 [Elysia crispata]